MSGPPLKGPFDPDRIRERTADAYATVTPSKPLTPTTAPVIDDFYPDASFEMRRGWEAAILATLDATQAVESGLREVTFVGPSNPGRAGLDPRSFTVHNIPSHWTEDAGACAVCAALARSSSAPAELEALATAVDTILAWAEGYYGTTNMPAGGMFAEAVRVSRAARLTSSPENPAPERPE